MNPLLDMRRYEDALKKPMCCKAQAYILDWQRALGKKLAFLELLGSRKSGPLDFNKD